MDSGRSPELPAADAALAAALAGPIPGEEAADVELLTLDELATHSDLPASLLEAVEREGLLIPRVIDGQRRYTRADAEALKAGLALVEAGLPLDELFNLAREHTAAMRTIADNAVELFVRFVRDPIRSQTSSEDEAAARLLTAFQQMLPATSTLVSHHFRRLLVNAAQARLTEAPGVRASASEPAGGDPRVRASASEPAGGDP
jgi:DNA-binding transcriptional MerR regulator